VYARKGKQARKAVKGEARRSRYNCTESKELSSHNVHRNAELRTRVFIFT